MTTPSLVGSLVGPKAIQQSNTDHAEQYKKCIKKLTGKSRYQYFLISFISVMWLIIVFNAMIGSFVFMNPLFECDGQSQTQKQACQHINSCVITNDFSAVHWMKLYCEKQHIRSTVQSTFAIGCVIGMLCLPLISDAIGRRNASIVAFIIGIIAVSTIIIAIKYDSQIFVIFGMGLTGIYGAGFTIIGFILTCDFCSEELRQHCLMIYCAMWGLGQMIFYLLYNYMPQWDKYLIFMILIPSAIMFIIMMFMFIQSPVYAIFVKKNPQLFVEIAQQLGNFNQVEPEVLAKAKKQGIVLIEMLKAQFKNELPLKETFQKILCNRANLIQIICLTLPNIAFNFFYYGMQGSMERTGYNFGVSMLLVGIHEFLAYLSASYFTKFIKRKIGVIVSVILTSIIGLMFLTSFVKESEITQTILISISRVTSVYAYCFIILLWSELIQVQIRSTGIALVDGIGQSSRILVPYIVNMMNNFGLHTLILSSIIFLFMGTLPILPLKEPLITEKQRVKNEYNILQNQKNNSEPTTNFNS